MHQLKIPLMTVTVSVLVLVLYVMAPFGSEWFQLLLASKREGIRWYTVITTQFLHTDLNHLFFDVFTFAVLSYCIEARCIAIKSWFTWFVTVITSFGGIAIWFLIQTEFNRYAGLSGALNGLFVVALYGLLDIEHSRIQNTFWNGVLLLLFIGLLVKNSYEFYFDVALFSNTRWRSTPSFHAVGMCIGIVLTAVFYWWENRRQPSRHDAD